MLLLIMSVCCSLWHHCYCLLCTVCHNNCGKLGLVVSSKLQMRFAILVFCFKCEISVENILQGLSQCLHTSLNLQDMKLVFPVIVNGIFEECKEISLGVALSHSG